MKKVFLETDLSKVYILIVGLFCIILLGSYFSYAMFTVSKEKSNAISIVTGNLTYDLKVDGENMDTLTIPANSSKEFTITLSNPNNRTARFNFYYEGELPSKVDAGYIVEEGTNTPPAVAGVNLESEGIGSSQVYKLKLVNVSKSSNTIKLGVSVGLDYNDLTLPSDGNLFTEYENTPNAPELDTNMIAVTYNGTNWIKADANSDDWYDYEAQEWANAVTVSESSRNNYLSAASGTPINMEDIETMWVWIPRYSYTIGSEDGTNYYGKQGDYLDSPPTKALPGEIDVLFVDSSVSIKGSAKYLVGDSVSNWYTPDAFTFDGEELNGIWVGKFETSSSNPSTTNGGGNVTNLDPMIKPNVTSWRNINVSNIYNVALKMNDAGNRYGFSSTTDTHVMKSSEWGAVAYLSQSKYGKLGNENFSGANKEIYQNKSDGFVTGCSYGSPSNGNTNYGCHYTYDIKINGTGASTTGNIYGIYDMSGGAFEYTMSNYNDIVGSSGFTSMPESKYYDKYISDNASLACNGNVCISHALSETAGWYNDAGTMISEKYPWLIRGGHYRSGNDSAGAFYYYIGGASGASESIGSFRLILNILN